MGILDFLNFDTSNVGYEDGYNDGVGGKPKTFWRMVQYKTAAKFALGGHLAIDSYCEAYKRGYDKGQEDRHSIKKIEIADSLNNNHINQDSIQKMEEDYDLEDDYYLGDDNQEDGFDISDEELEEECQSIIKGINALVKLYNFLIRDCCDRLQNIKVPLSEQVKNLSRTGVPIEACHTVNHEYIPVDWENFDALYNNIVECDLVLLEQLIHKQQQYYTAVTEEIYEPSLYALNEKTECQTNIIRRADNSTQSLSLQKSGFQAFINFLDRRIEDINKVCSKYDSFTENLSEIGLPEEYHEQYKEECYETNKELFDKIVKHLNQDKEYLEQCRDKL